MIDPTGLQRPMEAAPSPGPGGRHAKAGARGQDWLDVLVRTPAPPTRTDAVNANPTTTAESVVVDLVIAGTTHDGRATLSLPWRLSANGAIEQQGHGIATTLADPASIAQAGAMDASPTAGAQGRNATHLPPILMPSKAGSCFPDPAPERPRLYDPALHGIERGTAGAGAAGAPAAAEPWAERMVRLFGEQDGEVSVWVRDYALRRGDERGVVDAIRAFCTRHGVRVERIAINGHVLWTSRPTAPQQERA